MLLKEFAAAAARNQIAQTGRCLQANVPRKIEIPRHFFFFIAHISSACQDALITHWRQNIQKGAAKTIRGGNFQMVPSVMMRDGVCLQGCSSALKSHQRLGPWYLWRQGKPAPNLIKQIKYCPPGEKRAWLHPCT